MKENRREFQENVGKGLLQPLSLDTFRKHMTDMCRLIHLPSYADDVNYLMEYLYRQVTKPLPAKVIGFKTERQYRAAFAMWTLIPHLPDSLASEKLFKEDSRNMLLDAFVTASDDDNNPYLRDFAKKTLESRCG